MHYYDPEGKGYIHCEHFMKSFVKLGIDERHKKAGSWRQHQKELNKERAIQAQLKQQVLIRTINP